MKNTIDTTTQTAISRMEFDNKRSEAQIQNGQQLHLSFAPAICRRPPRRGGQMLRSRAQGWFDLMRRVVDNAVEWKPAALARPEQTALDLRRAA